MRQPGRDGVGAELTLPVGDRRLVRHVKADPSYLAQSDLPVHFGLGTAERAARLEIWWPGGRVDVIEDIAPGRILTVRKGEGVVGETPYSVR